MKKVITYGTFDLFHQGHANLLRRAKELGDYLIVGVTTDNFDIQRGKINTHDSLMTRIEAVRNSGYADQVILEEFNGQKISDIIRYNVDVFAIGSDWEGKFDYLKEYCQVVYLPRTEGVSSTMLRHKNPLRIGMVGTGNIAGRFADEARLVQHIELTANEYLLLEHLLRHPGRIFSPRIIAESVWGLRAPLRGKAVETRVYSLRKKLRVGGRPDIIVNERGFGYVVRAES